jgi:hypothetical protein
MRHQLKRQETDMQRYVTQLLADIADATANLERPYREEVVSIHDWISDEEEDLSPEEERARALAIELEHIKRRYGDEWEKYYPYHLDPKYDDADGNPYDYGFGGWEEEDPADWWKKG